jgi:dihydropyrimidinase
MYDLLIVNGTVVSPTGTEAYDVAVTGETITAIGERGSLGTEAAKVIDATGCLVIPGGIDPHVHYAMNFENIILTEGPPYSFAAALGGNTMVIDFAFQEPPQGLMEACASRSSKARWPSTTVCTPS